MGHSRKLTDQERRQIVRERAKGVSIGAISAALKVSPKTVYNVLSRGRSAVSANDNGVGTALPAIGPYLHPVVAIEKLPANRNRPA